MRKRKIVLPDGRYLIFYTFEDQVKDRSRAQGEARRPESREGAAAPPESERVGKDK
jgi:hypothetical protein